MGARGSIIRGHEFHYARITDPGRDEPFAMMADGEALEIGTAGGRRGLVTGTFFHAVARD